MTRYLAASLILFALVACAPKATTTAPAAPTPPQIKLTQDMAVLRNALPVALTSLQAARIAGKLTAQDVTEAENKVLVPIAMVGKAIDAEVITADDWPTMRAKVLSIITRAGLAGAYASLPPQSGAIVAAVVAAYNTVAASVGGPILQ